MREGLNSIWGRVQGCEQIFRGCYHISTASHGGYYLHKQTAKAILKPQVFDAMPKHGYYLAFEEDCAWSLLALSSPMDFCIGFSQEKTNRCLEEASATAKRYFPGLINKL